MWQAPLERVHVTRIGDGCARRSVGVHIHRGLGSGATTVIGGAACVQPALAVLGTAMVSGLEAGVIAADAALARDLMITDDDLRDWLGRLAGHPRVRTARLAVGLADARSESVGESRTRLLLAALDLGTAVPQVEIRDDAGHLVARVDFLYGRQQTIVEFDGLVKYSGAEGRQALIAEKRREDRLRDLGYQVVRVTWAELDRPVLLRQRILAAFARAESH